MVSGNSNGYPWNNDPSGTLDNKETGMMRRDVFHRGKEYAEEDQAT